MQLRRSNDELLKLAQEHLSYEFEMLNKSAVILSNYGIVFGAGITNALIESFTIHARVLYGFLWGKKQGPDDAIASDYFDDPLVWDDNPPAIPPILERINGRVGKEVAHLTYTRLLITPEEKHWPFMEIASALNGCFFEFTRRAPQDRLGELVNLSKMDLQGSTPR